LKLAPELIRRPVHAAIVVDRVAIAQIGTGGQHCAGRLTGGIVAVGGRGERLTAAPLARAQQLPLGVVVEGLARAAGEPGVAQAGGPIHAVVPDGGHLPFAVGVLVDPIGAVVAMGVRSQRAGLPAQRGVIDPAGQSDAVPAGDVAVLGGVTVLIGLAGHRPVTVIGGRPGVVKGIGRTVEQPATGVAEAGGPSRAFAGELQRPPPLIADPVEQAAVLAWLKGVEYHLGAGPAMDRMLQRVPFDDDGYGAAWAARWIVYVRELIRAGRTPEEWVSNEFV